jgi:hypothetical protein
MRVLGALLILALAGCLGSSPAPPTTPAPNVFVDPITSETGHDHADPSQHNLSLNTTLLGHHFLTEQDGEAPGSHSIDLCGDWVVLGRQEAGQTGVDIVDVSDPMHPEWVGKYRDPNAAPGDRDVAWSADCDYVFNANGGSQAQNSGVLVINAKDKSRPVFESRFQIPGTFLPPNPVSGGVTPGVHTIYALQVGSTQYVYALNWGVHILRAAPGSDGKLALNYAGRYAAADADSLERANEGGADATATRRTVYGHDLSVYEEAGRVIMYVAYAYDGLRIVDITDPLAPTELGHWRPDATPGAPHYVHSVKTYHRADGRRITVLGAETFEDRNKDTPSPLWTLDTTDPARIQLLDTWTNPGGHGSELLFMSLHFYELENETLWLTHYHGGVWTLDLRDPSDLKVKGYYMPHEDNGFRPAPFAPGGFKQDGMPMTYDLKLRNGIAYVADDYTGLYVLRAT